MAAMLRSPRVFALTAASCLTFLAVGCPGQGPKEAAQGAADAGPPADQAASQPSIPAGHSTSTAPIGLDQLFKMPETPEVVAKVGDGEIKRPALENLLRQLQIQLRAAGLPRGINRQEVLKSAVDQLVDMELKRQIAEELGVKVDKKAVEEWVSNIEAKMDADPAFRTFLLQAGNTREQRLADGEFEVMMEGINMKLAERIQTRTATTLKAYYDSHLGDFTEHAGVETWRIFIKAPMGMAQRDRDLARARADETLKMIKKAPKKFDLIARERSEGGTVSTGGYIGFVARGTLAKAIEDQLFAAKPNSLLPLYEDANGFYIYKVGKKRPQRVRPLKEVEGEIFLRIFRPMLDEQLAKDLAALRAKKEVQIFVPELN